MKKYLIPFLIVVSIIAFSCTKKSSPAGPSSPASTATISPTSTKQGTVTNTATITCTSTITSTSTITCTFTVTCTSTDTTVPTATPNIAIYASMYVSGAISYWVTFNVNGTYYQYATVTVSDGTNTDTLVSNGSSAYVTPASPMAYTPGANYSVVIQSEFGVYSGTITGPGGNVTVNTYNVVSYTYNGNSDFLIVYDSGYNPLYYSASDYPDISPGFIIPGSIFVIPGTYYVYVYPTTTLTSGFTGPNIPSQNTLTIETITQVTVSE